MDSAEGEDQNMLPNLRGLDAILQKRPVPAERLLISLTRLGEF